MKRVLLLALGVVVLASVASSQGVIGLYSDSSVYTECNLVDVGPSLCSVYLVQQHVSGISSSLMVDNSNSGGLVSLSVVYHAALTIGDLFTGIEFSYGACSGPTVLLATLNYFCQGTTPACSSIHVVPHPGTGIVTIVDCSARAVQAEGGFLTINGNYLRCPCSAATTCQSCPDPAEERSWGRIKALYGDD
ncbi:MAG: hypothetical protein OEN01_12885 [Candidatus Krumholzibacteria bacterium]|nr:hypothetical protein [Candidatus Krumholzibacteria bacterium]